MPYMTTTSWWSTGSGGARVLVVLKVDNPMGTGLNLLTGDVQQHASVVPSMLGVTKVIVNLL
jgi:hypothetical protein